MFVLSGCIIALSYITEAKNELCVNRNNGQRGSFYAELVTHDNGESLLCTVSRSFCFLLDHPLPCTRNRPSSEAGILLVTIWPFFSHSLIPSLTHLWSCTTTCCVWSDVQTVSPQLAPSSSFTYPVYKFHPCWRDLKLNISNSVLSVSPLSLPSCIQPPTQCSSYWYFNPIIL